MESVALKKPVIILELTEHPKKISYVEEKVAIGVYKLGELEDVINKLLKDDSDLAKNRENYITKNFYQMDGKATERLVKIIESLLCD